MIINKATSDAVLVDALVVLEPNGKPVKNITAFNTETMEATLSAGGPVTAASYRFEASSVEDRDAILALIDAAYPVTIEDGHAVYQPNDPRFDLTYKTKFRGKKGMKDADSLPDNVLQLSTGKLSVTSMVCSNCSTCFLVYVANDKSIWSAARVKAGDKFDTLTEVDTSTLTCDNCDEAVSIYDPM